MEQRLNILTLGVRDLKKSADFYENTFGWNKSPLSNDNIIFFELRGLILSLYSHEELAIDAMVDPSSSGFKGFTLAYNARSQQEVDDLVSSMRKKGVEVLKEPQKVFWGGYSSYIADPDRNLWEIAYNPFLPQALV